MKVIGDVVVFHQVCRLNSCAKPFSYENTKGGKPRMFCSPVCRRRDSNIFKDKLKPIGGKRDCLKCFRSFYSKDLKHIHLCTTCVESNKLMADTYKGKYDKRRG